MEAFCDKTQEQFAELGLVQFQIQMNTEISYRFEVLVSLHS